MSKFSEKIRRGELPSEEDWSEHLLEGHAHAPSQTPQAFAAHKTTDGQNSYEVLAGELQHFQEKNLSILDLACGDGHLIPHLLPKLGSKARILGIDMSEAELAVAKQSQKDPRVSFQQSKAQKLPVPDQSVDLILCHMALMLMLPLEPVIGEIARVLKPGGRFSAVVGNRGGHQGLFAEIAKRAFDFVGTRYPTIRDAKTGDPRIYSPEGLQSLFRKELGFSGEVDRTQFDLNYNILPAGIWELLKNMYNLAVLSPAEREELRELITRFGQEYVGAEGKIHFKYSAIQFSVRRAS